MKRVAVQRKRKVGNTASLKNPVAKSAKKVPYSSVQPALFEWYRHVCIQIKTSIRNET